MSALLDSNLALFASALLQARNGGMLWGVDSATTSPAEAFAEWCQREHSEGWFESFPAAQRTAIRDAYDKAWMRGFSLRHLLKVPANMNAIRRAD